MLKDSVIQVYHFVYCKKVLFIIVTIHFPKCFLSRSWSSKPRKTWDHRKKGGQFHSYDQGVDEDIDSKKRKWHLQLLS